MPPALSTPPGREWNYLSSGLQQWNATVPQRRRGQGLCRWQGRWSKDETFPLGQSDVCPPFHLHSQRACVAFLFLCFEQCIPLCLEYIHMCLPNLLVASCDFSPQLDYKLLKVHATPLFSPTVLKQFWAGAQETRTERRDQRINLPEPSGRESWWYCGWADSGLKSVSWRCQLDSRHHFLWVPSQTQLRRHRGPSPKKRGSNSHIFICHVTHIISEPLRSPCISEHWQSSIKFWGKLWNLWNENQFHL